MKKIILTFLLLLFSFPAVAGEKGTAYDRVLKTKKIRCAYGLWEPVVMRDPNTGEMSGFFVDLMDQIGQALDIEVEWSMEVDWGQIPTILSSGKVDAHCAGMWASPNRGTRVAFTKPVFYTPVVAVVRADDTRFDENIMLVNNENIRISVGDDDITEEIATRDFPEAQSIPKPALSGEEQHLMVVADGKADITFNEVNYIKGYMKKNPGKVKIIHPDAPLRVFGNTVGVNIHETALLAMLNNTLIHLLDSGAINRIFEKYKEDYDISYYLYPRTSFEPVTSQKGK
ncbi:MAG: transporter substrate-binding domain-containing protein [Alphaproteobacteria bacterium]|nr:transporter substrate-binding domain-containing protein [Alphaproteobacteria bacterium]